MTQTQPDSGEAGELEELKAFMRVLGFGLFKNGKEFYQLGREIEPRLGIVIPVDRARRLVAETRNQVCWSRDHVVAEHKPNASIAELDEFMGGLGFSIYPNGYGLDPSHRRGWYKDGLHLFEPNVRVLISAIQRLIQRERLKARITALTAFEPLQRHHDKCLDPKSCIGYQNATSDFDNEKELLIDKLETKLAKLTEESKS